MMDHPWIKEELKRQENRDKLVGMKETHIKKTLEYEIWRML